MLQLITNYVLIGIAVLIPVLFLAGVVWVLVRPLSLEDVERRHRERHGAGEPPAGSGAGAGTGSGTGTGGRKGHSRRRPRRPGRAA